MIEYKINDKKLLTSQFISFVNSIWNDHRAACPARVSKDGNWKHSA